MKGYELFIEKINEFSFDVKNKVMCKIFGIDFLTFDFLGTTDRFFIRGYDGDFYYQFCFIFNLDDTRGIIINEEKNMLICTFYLKTILSNCRFNGLFLRKKFYNFLKIIEFGDISYFDSFL